MTKDTFRLVYREPTDEEKRQIDDIKDAATVLESYILKLPTSRHRSLAITNLEQSVFWAVKGVTG